jgi:predicted ATPase
VAAELAEEFPDGVWLIDLVPVGDPATVPEAVTYAQHQVRLADE